MNPIVIDLGVGNTRSLSSALTYLGVNHTVTADPAALSSATHIILPGVGAFDAAMQVVAKLSLAEPIRECVVQKKTPLLGICLGMQILFQASEEGSLAGLALMPGRFLRLAPNPDLHRKVPHVGFAPIHGYRDAGLFKELGASAHFYFTHSYALPALDDCNVAVCDPLRPFVSAFQKENICGVQFHPEKSQSTGLRLISNFIELAA
jgi:imidazole glycerol-phosphate synthase subunit HisH